MLSRATATISAIIVDDETLACDELSFLLKDFPDIEVVASAKNGLEAVKLIENLEPDLVFLDVQMPKLDGFEVLELIDPDVAVIFVTAYDEYAMRAFDAHAVDYLLKPFGEERLWKALDRARELLAMRDAAAGRLRTQETVSSAESDDAAVSRNAGTEEDGAAPGKSQAEAFPAGRAELAAAARPPSQKLDRIVVRDGTKVHIIPVAKLDYVEAQDDYISLHSEKKSYLKQQTISVLERQLDGRQFVRIHRSYIVRLDRIARIEPYAKDSRVVVLTDGTQLPVSRPGYARLKELLANLA
jgi:two-component system LytT family response regulator